MEYKGNVESGNYSSRADSMYSSQGGSGCNGNCMVCTGRCKTYRTN